MNAAHFHLITNHIPIVGLFCGLFMLIWALVSKNKSITVAATALIFLCSIGGIAANKSGEEAEDLVEQIAGISKTAIHEHEEAAELAMPFIFISIVFSSAGLYLNRRNHRWSNIVNYILLASCALACILSARAGWLGGKIRHAAEINAGKVPSQNYESEKEHD
jgi:uncharacterized membrane protein